MRLRRYARPAAFLLAVTAIVAGFRATHRHRPAPAPAHRAQQARKQGPRFYVVRAGDTLALVAGRTGVPAARLRRLNPKVQSTALFLGQRIRLR